MHLLDFNIPNELNSKAFRINDLSVYDADILVRNAIIEVSPSGFHSPIIFHVNKGFELVLNANLLYLNTSGVHPIPNLPDRMYTIKYSVDPNAKVNVEYYYFRNVLQEIEYFKLLTSLIDNNKSGRINNHVFNTMQEELFSIKEYISAAKFRAEELLDCEGALAMYEDVNDKLKNFKTCQ